MKKIVRIVSMLMVVVFIGAALASCSNISQSYADKVNKAAEDGEAFTKEKVLEDLGEDAVDVNLLVGGVVIAVKGCDSIDDIKAQLDEGKTVKGIVVTIVLGKATGAVYKEITEDDLK